LKSKNFAQQHLSSLGGIKVIAMLLLFWWHSSIPNPNVDLGARTCELLFVTSGFLVGYNYFYKGMPKTWKASFMYAIKKIIRFWPLHFCVLLIMFLRTIIINGCIQLSNILIALDNALLLQAWSLNQDVYFSYNGASWFLSALIFCYFMTPLLLTFCQKIKQSIVLFVMIAAIRYLIEYVNIKCPGMVWNFVIHTSPFIRCLEFFMGMLLVPLFMYTKEKLQSSSFFINSLVEIIITILTIALCIMKNATWLRASFVFLFCITVFVFAFNRGILSRIFSARIFELFGKIQFEFFIFHQAIIICLFNWFSRITSDWRIVNSLLFITIIACAIGYKKFMSQKLSKIISNGIRKLFGYFEIAPEKL